MMLPPVVVTTIVSVAVCPNESVMTMWQVPAATLVMVNVYGAPVACDGENVAIELQSLLAEVNAPA